MLIFGTFNVFSLGAQGSFPGWVILKAQKMVLDPSLLNT